MHLSIMVQLHHQMLIQGNTGNNIASSVSWCGMEIKCAKMVILFHSNRSKIRNNHFCLVEEKLHLSPGDSLFQ